MILVRDVFQLKFGMARDAVALMKEFKALSSKFGYDMPMRVCTDLTGPYYTLVMETTYESLTAMEKMFTSEMGQDEWKAWYERFKVLCDSGHREIFTIVSL